LLHKEKVKYLFPFFCKNLVEKKLLLPHQKTNQIKQEVMVQQKMPERPVTLTSEERALIGQWADSI
jgi:hypothetical protein